MKSIIKYIGCLSIIIALNLSGYSQSSALPKEITIIKTEIEKLSSLSYDYKIYRNYPDNTADSLKGQVYSCKDYFKETAGPYFLIQDKRWFYKVDHSGKTVTVSDVTKLPFKSNYEKPAALFSDSAVYKFGKIRVQTTGDILKVYMDFGREVLLKHVYLEYDRIKKLPVLYKIEMDIPYNINEINFEETFVRQIFIARNFVSNQPKKRDELTNYFSYNGKEIKLKKYGNYKLMKF